MGSKKKTTTTTNMETLSQKKKKRKKTNFRREQREKKRQGHQSPARTPPRKNILFATSATKIVLFLCGDSYTFFSFSSRTHRSERIIIKKTTNKNILKLSYICMA